MAYVPPLTVLFVRYLVAGVALLILLKKAKRPKIERKDYKYIVFIGVIGYFVSVSAQLIGTKLLNAGLASLLNSLNPILMLVFAVPFLKEKITMAKVISVTAAIVGVYIIIGRGGKGGEVLGIIVSLISVIAWSLTSVIVKRFTQKYDPLTITTYSILVALACTAPFSVYELVTTPNVEFFHPGILCGLIYIGLVCTALTNVLWNKSLSMIEAGRCALFYPLQPMVATILGSLFLGEVIHFSFIIGAAFIIGGVVFSVVPDKTRRQRA
jgi:drug/metabolite transporter (DMT)-like permease